MGTRKTITLLALVLVGCLFSGPLRAEQPAKVAIIPFKMNADRDLSFLRDGIVDMLTTRLAWENKVVVMPREATESAVKDVRGQVNESVARQIGTGLGVDYVLFGSLTVFGQSVSMDAKMVDIHGLKPPVTVFNQSEGMDAVIPNINVFATDINEKVFGRVVAQRREAPTPTTQAQEAPGIYAHPDKLLGSSGGDQEQVSGLNPDFIVTAGRRESSSFWKSQNFEANIKAISVGDVDADGQQETAFITQGQVFVYRNAERRFLKLKEISGDPQDSFISVDVADINQNGPAEIFVTNLNSQRKVLESFVLEWNGSDFVRISEKNNWYYRVHDLPTRGRVLFAQKRGLTSAFLSGIYELAWQNGNYEPVSTLDLPNDTNVFGFMLGDPMHEGGEMVLAFDENDHLRILSRSGKKEWKSDEPYGGSVNYLETQSNDADSKKEEDKERLYLGQRIFIRDLDQDGKEEVIVVKNQGTGSRLFKRFRNYSSSEIVNLSWDGLGLALNWKTRKVQGYVSDFAIEDFDNDGQNEIVAAVVLEQGVSLLMKPKSVIISYDLIQPEKQDQTKSTQ
jgi:TolB-like protein